MMNVEHKQWVPEHRILADQQLKQRVHYGHHKKGCSDEDIINMGKQYSSDLKKALNSMRTKVPHLVNADQPDEDQSLIRRKQKTVKAIKIIKRHRQRMDQDSGT
jgi:hypothetical protein